MPDTRVYGIIPRTRAEIGLEYVYGRKKTQSLEEVMVHIQELLDEALETTIMEVKMWIEVHVAKRSGDLQASLIKFLEKSIPPKIAAREPKGIRLVLGVGAEIDYAKYVNEMTMARVRHMGTWLEHSGKPAMSKGKPVFLDDPRAVGFYHDKMVEFGVERFKYNVDKARYKFQIGE